MAKPQSANGFRPEDYGSTVNALLATAPLNDLGPGKPVKSMAAELNAISPDGIFGPQQILDQQMAQACLAGLWLRFDFLDESHSISQRIAGPTGSYWHAIMHRREPDYWNSKYWFRQVGEHPIFDQLSADAAQFACGKAASRAAAFLTEQKRWDPLKFVDLVEATCGTGTADETLCREIQRREWELLFDYCYRTAIGRDGPL